MAWFRHRLIGTLVYSVMAGLLPGQAVAEDTGGRAATNLTIEIASQMPRQGVIGTRRNDVQRLTVLDGATLKLTRYSGRDHQLQAGSGWTWTQVQQVPANLASLVLTPTRVDEHTVAVAIELIDRNGDRGVHYQSTVSVPIDEWVSLYDNTNAQHPQPKTYSTRASSADQLFIRVLP